MAAIVDRMAPLPLACIHATGDEYVPVAEVQKIVAMAREPKRLWVLDAADHRFSNRREELDRRLLEAIAWIREQTPR